MEKRGAKIHWIEGLLSKEEKVAEVLNIFGR